ncbi:MAG: cupin domain-containing protein [Candidatus Moranbacteria bacterium]|nr:cupin domain-containing protein [Candidatus Moranbacteria bacterium]
MNHFLGNIEKKTLENANYREVLYTGPMMQLVVMSVPVSEEIGEEIHADHDQFIRCVAGQGKALLDGTLYDITNGDAIVVPAGTRHNVINASTTDALKFYTIYAPPEHKPDTIHPRKSDVTGG